ncbi:MAG: hypothetical protein GY856_37045 [bacterium]|nr:hypothetical protein [bacterium]
MSQPQLTPRQELLGKAARCYRSAGYLDGACRCLEAGGNLAAAGLLHEQAQRWADAARCFESSGHWDAAASCHLANGEPVDGARCLVTAGRQLEAGWIFAHEAHRYDRARATLAQVNPETPEQTLARDLVLARCEAAREHNPAGQAVQRATTELGRLSPGPVRTQVVEWALVVADVLDRPDLTAQLQAAAVAAGLPDSVQRWETWALARLGSAEGIPVSAEEE